MIGRKLIHLQRQTPKMAAERMPADNDKQEKYKLKKIDYGTETHYHIRDRR